MESDSDGAQIMKINLYFFRSTIVKIKFHVLSKCMAFINVCCQLGLVHREVTNHDNIIIS